MKVLRKKQSHQDWLRAIVDALFDVGEVDERRWESWRAALNGACDLIAMSDFVEVDAIPKRVEGIAVIVVDVHDREVA